MNVTTYEDEIKAVTTQLEDAKRRGVDWIVGHLAGDGEPVGAARFNHYYRVPWALALGGRSEAASSAMSWIERHALTTSGDLQPGAPQTNWNVVGWTKDASSYPLAIMAVGAWHLERYDTALSIMTTLEAFQDPANGGGYIERPELRTTGLQDALCTAQIGMAALETGRRSMADAAFRWFEAWFRDQPEFPARLYLMRDVRGLVTEGDASNAAGRWVDFAKPRQTFFNPGISAAFLGRYYMQTRTPAALDIARALMRAQDDATDLQYDFADTVHVGKFGWGASALMDIEPTADNLPRLLRMGRWYVESQLPDGRWNPTHFLVPDPDDSDALWKTGEHVMLISQVLVALGGYPRRGPKAA